VVADSRDLLALERTREFQGRYHVLGGLISPMDGIGPEALHIQPLVRRVAGAGEDRGEDRCEDRGDDAVGGDPGSAEVRDSPISEVILALTPSVEGDTTSLYLARLIKPFTTVSRIAYGLPMGSELEYADEVTLARAFEGRRAVE
jgi:recombination protein RecR